MVGARSGSFGAACLCLSSPAKGNQPLLGGTRKSPLDAIKNAHAAKPRQDSDMPSAEDGVFVRSNKGKDMTGAKP
jgi:hypothetical protein